LQINIDNELTKSGVLPEKIDTILAQFEHLDKLSLRGFMCIPSPSNSGIRVFTKKIFFLVMPFLKNSLVITPIN
jgi:uncharacterized pyridoxal phosphate-containing UPF0001 family protein